MATKTTTSTAKSHIHRYGIRTISNLLEVKWDGVNWTDESDYLISAMGNVQLNGDLGEGIATEADFELENVTKRFLPENTLSPIYAYLTFRKEIRYSIIINGVTTKLFTGYIKTIEPNRQTGIVNFHCFDNSVKLANKRCPRTPYTDITADAAIRLLAYEAGLTDPEMNLDVSTHVIRALALSDQYIFPTMGQIAAAETGRLFLDENGILTFWNRERINTLSAISATLTQSKDLKNIEFNVDEEAIKNRCIITATPKGSAGIQAVWTNGDVEVLNPYSDTLIWLPAHGSQTAMIELEETCTTWITPVPNTDYTANSASDGSGTDYTGSVAVTYFQTYGNAAAIIVQNYANVPVYLTRFQIRANPLRIYRWIKVSYIDETSANQYGEQAIEIENNFMDDESFARQIAENNVLRYRNTKNLFKASIIGNTNISCGDLVSVELTTGSYGTYMINEITWKVDQASGFTQDLGLMNQLKIPFNHSIDTWANIFNHMTKTITSKARIS